MQQGAALAGRYRLVELIGAGGMGEVWRATDAILGRTVAVKVVLPDLQADPQFGRRFLAEARALASVHHPGVVAIHDFGETELSDRSGPQGTAAFLVMEHVAGEPLSALLRRVGRLSPETTMDLVRQTAQALQAVHEHGIVHRDIKPANLLIRLNGAIVLTDFGIATNPDATALTMPGMILGTPSYLAPEQVLGQPVSALSDVYALGVVAYECLAGQKPFVADDPFAAALQRVHRPAPPLPADVPQHVARVVAQALAAEPAQRWQTAAEFGLAAERAIAGTGAAHNPPTGSQAGPLAETPAPAKAERPAQP
uniref:serine/threonine-protein kinase n=1 Tax=Allorhizocola rhizosphaerae TaxID=1872709 RepID=UPI0013C37BB6